MKVELVTAIYGGYDRPKQLPESLNIPATLFTDSEETAELAVAAGWSTIIDKMENVETPMLRAKWWKTHPLSAAPDADVSVWLDGSMTVDVDDFAAKCLAALSDDDVSMMPHPTRTCIYHESVVAAQLLRYSEAGLKKQSDFYRDVVGHPTNWGLFASGTSVRRHSDIVKTWGEYWWDDCVNWSWQDQLSLPVITRMMTTRGLKWNTNIPWWTWWHLTEHGF